MKIRMLTGISGPDIALGPKAETDVFSYAEALRLMLSEQAEPADDEAAEALALAIAPEPAAPVISLERPARPRRPKAKKV